MSTYFSQSKGQTIEMSTMHPGHLVNALNKQAKEAVIQGDNASPEQLRFIGELVVTLVGKGFALEAKQVSNEGNGY